MDRISIRNLEAGCIARVSTACTGSTVLPGDLLVRLSTALLHLPGIGRGAEVSELSADYDSPRAAVDIMARGVKASDIAAIIDQPRARQLAVAEAIGRLRQAQHDLSRMGVWRNEL